MTLPLHIVISDNLTICESRLVGSINATETSLSVTSGDGSARFPAYAPFLVLIESEIVLVTAVSTDTFTIERGARETTAASHTGNTPLRAIEYSEDIKRIHGFITEKTTEYTATSSDNTILADGNVKINLPTVSGNAGFGYTIMNVGSTGKVTLDGYEDERINGEPEIELTLQYQFVTIKTDGTEWFIIGGVYVKMDELLQEQLEKQEEIITALKNIETHLELGSDEELEKGEEE